MAVRANTQQALFPSLRVQVCTYLVLVSKQVLFLLFTEFLRNSVKLPESISRLILLWLGCSKPGGHFSRQHVSTFSLRRSSVGRAWLLQRGAAPALPWGSWDPSAAFHRLTVLLSRLALLYTQQSGSQWFHPWELLASVAELGFTLLQSSRSAVSYTEPQKVADLHPLQLMKPLGRYPTWH